MLTRSSQQLNAVPHQTIINHKAHKYVRRIFRKEPQ